MGSRFQLPVLGHGGAGVHGPASQGFWEVHWGVWPQVGLDLLPVIHCGLKGSPGTQRGTSLPALPSPPSPSFFPLFEEGREEQSGNPQGCSLIRGWLQPTGPKREESGSPGGSEQAGLCSGSPQGGLQAMGVMKLLPRAKLPLRVWKSKAAETLETF